MSWFVNFLAEKVGWHGGENDDEVYRKQKVNIKYPTQIFVKMHHTRTVRVLTLANTCTKHRVLDDCHHCKTNAAKPKMGVQKKLNF